MTEDRGNEHPQELLAEYVDGTLEGERLARVEEHLAGCEACREEVDLAGRARAALAELPEVPAPAGLDLGVRRQVRRGGRRVWQAAGAAAVAAGVIAAAVIVGQGLGGGPAEQAAPGGEPQALEADDQGGGGQGSEEADEVDKEGTDRATAAFAQPELRFTTSEQDYTPPTLANLGRRLKDQARTVLARGFPPTAQAFYEAFDEESLDPQVRNAASCVLAEVPPQQDVVPFFIQQASFDGEPAFVAGFLQGPSSASPYDRVLIWVVHRETCALQYYASHLL